jgi:hypothetical protein
MKNYKQWVTTGVALGIVGVLAGCATSGNTDMSLGSIGTRNISESKATLNVANTSQPTNIVTKPVHRPNPENTSTSTAATSPTSPTSTTRTDTSHRTADHGEGMGQQSGSKSATAGYLTGLKRVTYSSSKVQNIMQLSQEQGITAYVPAKMGGPSGYYVPGLVSKDLSHSMSIGFEDMTFYEAASWTDIRQSLSPRSGSLTILIGGRYTLTGTEQGQWYTLEYSDGARSDLFVLHRGGTWIAVVPNPAKSTIPSLVQAVAETLQPIS